MTRQLNVLINCEESGRVRDEFRKLGHNAWSCDLQPCDPSSPFAQFHIQADGLLVAGQPWIFPQIPTVAPFSPWWDLMIAHPPCTYLCNSGVTWLFKNPDSRVTLTRRANHIKGLKGWTTRPANRDRVHHMISAADFFSALWHMSGIKHIAIENPIMHGYARQRLAKRLPPTPAYPTQRIQPWMFGHAESKATCLWLKNLPPLAYNVAAANATKAYMQTLPKSQTQRLHYMGPGKNRAKERSRTFQGIALAMATQWSEYIEQHG